jgi:hypothetical protein
LTVQLGLRDYNSANKSPSHFYSYFFVASAHIHTTVGIQIHPKQHQNAEKDPEGHSVAEFGDVHLEAEGEGEVFE